MLASALQQCDSARPFPLELPSHHPTSLGWHRARAMLPASHSKFPLAVLHTVVSIFPSYPQFIPPSPSPTVSTSVFSMSASRLLPCRERLLSTISLDFLCLFNIWRLFFSNLLHCVKQTLGFLFSYFRDLNLKSQQTTHYRCWFILTNVHGRSPDFCDFHPNYTDNLSYNCASGPCTEKSCNAQSYPKGRRKTPNT